MFLTCCTYERFPPSSSAATGWRRVLESFPAQWSQTWGCSCRHPTPHQWEVSCHWGNHPVRFQCSVMALHF
jgi:hypothetical protein